MKYNKISNCLIIKDENCYINEWLKWHIDIGINHFYIYDNNSIKPIEDSIIQEYKKYCTIIPFNGFYKRAQIEAYTDCLKKYKDENEWIAFIDTDEFINPRDNNLIEFLNNFHSYDVDAICLKWKVFGANNQYNKSDKLVRERFTKIGNYPKNLPQCKCIVNTKRIDIMGAHFPIIKGGKPYNIVNEYNKIVNGVLDTNISNDIVSIDHYFTRSLQEWKEKINRGSCDSLSTRNFDFFWIVNPEMEYVKWEDIKI